jgi:hypothetical protein
MCETFSMSGEKNRMNFSMLTGRRLAGAFVVSAFAIGAALAQTDQKPTQVKSDAQIDAKTQEEINRSIAEAMKEVDKAMKGVNIDIAQTMKDVDRDVADAKVSGMGRGFHDVEVGSSKQHVHVSATHVKVPAIHIRIPAQHFKKDGKNIEIPEIKVDVPEIKIDIPDIDVDIPDIHVKPGKDD